MGWEGVRGVGVVSGLGSLALGVGCCWWAFLVRALVRSVQVNTRRKKRCKSLRVRQRVMGGGYHREAGDGGLGLAWWLLGAYLGAWAGGGVGIGVVKVMVLLGLLGGCRAGKVGRRVVGACGMVCCSGCCQGYWRLSSPSQGPWGAVGDGVGGDWGGGGGH